MCVSHTFAVLADYFAGMLSGTISKVGSQELPCSDSRVPEVLDGLSTLRNGAVNLEAASVNPRAPDYVRAMSQRRLAIIVPLALQTHFSAADHLLNMGCLNHADQVYRWVVEGFPGSAYAG